MKLTGSITTESSECCIVQNENPYELTLQYQERIEVTDIMTTDDSNSTAAGMQSIPNILAEKLKCTFIPLCAYAITNS